MATYLNKTIIMLLLCLIFIGQSMASISMLYSMTKMQNMAIANTLSHVTVTNNATETMTKVPGCHSDKNAKTTPKAPNFANDDCCGQNCNCLTTGCSTITAFSAIKHYTPEVITPNKITLPTHFVTSQTLTSLFRPPILS